MGLWEIATLWVILWPVIAVHEAGHALAARLFGAAIREVRVGVGPVLLRIPAPEGEVTVRLVPLAGWCGLGGPMPPAPRFTMLIAGPALSGLAAVAAFAVAPWVPGVQMFGQLSTALAVVSLLPFPPLDGWFAVLALVERKTGKLDPERVYTGARVIAWAAIGIFAVSTLLMFGEARW